MIVGGVILPHPPVLLPDYAARRGREVDGTIAAVERACAWLAGLAPERIVVSSPHTEHGFDVPLFFLRRALRGAPAVERLLTDDPSCESYRHRGRRLREREDQSPARTALVASGDLSHRLREDGPYGFHECGPALDRAIVMATRAADADALLAIDPRVVEEGAECGLRSFVFALSAAAPARTEILSYQGPYGVGYMVATISPG